MVRRDDGRMLVFEQRPQSHAVVTDGLGDDVVQLAVDASIERIVHSTARDTSTFGCRR
jgi:hypothetical protein